MFVLLLWNDQVWYFEKSNVAVDLIESVDEGTEFVTVTRTPPRNTQGTDT